MLQQFSKFMKKNLSFFDIAANLTDEQFGSSKTPCDRKEVIERARQVGCSHLLIAAGNMQDAKESYELCSQYENSYCTIGVHPCRASQPFDKEKYGSVEQYFKMLDLQAQRIKGKLVAIGQCGLDYDRLNYSSKEQQLAIFPLHFQIAQKYKLPLYLHNRNTGDDFYQIVRKNRHRFSTGVVHSFTGNAQEIQKIISLDLYIGINGCSFKTLENIEVLKHIPLERIMLETDSPYCQIRNSHAGSKFVKTKFPTKNKRTQGFLLKGRNQPCKILQVLQVLSSVLSIPQQQLSQISFKNSLKFFNIK